MKLSHYLWLRRQNMNKNSKTTIIMRIMIAGEYKDLSLRYLIEPK
ncbi:MAG: hypothetical protein ACTHLD_13020 [Chitinophaga sp.]